MAHLKPTLSSLHFQNKKPTENLAHSKSAPFKVHFLRIGLGPQRVSSPLYTLSLNDQLKFLFELVLSFYLSWF